MARAASSPAVERPPYRAASRREYGEVGGLRCDQGFATLGETARDPASSSAADVPDTSARISSVSGLLNRATGVRFFSFDLAADMSTAEVRTIFMPSKY